MPSASIPFSFSYPCAFSYALCLCAFVPCACSPMPLCLSLALLCLMPCALVPVPNTFLPVPGTLVPCAFVPGPSPSVPMQHMERHCNTDTTECGPLRERDPHSDPPFFFDARYMVFIICLTHHMFDCITRTETLIIRLGLLIQLAVQDGLPHDGV